MLISIAGNIGAGKSSIIALLHEHYGWKPLYESVLDNPYLADFYADPPAWAYHSQLYFLSKHCASKETIPDGKSVAVQDRSIYEDADIFAAFLYGKRWICDRDYETYREFYRGLLSVIPKPKLVVYLRADTEALIANIRNRGRDYERSLPRGYIAELNERYNDWAENMTECPLTIIDAGKFEFLHDTQAQEEIVHTIRRLVH